MKQKQTADSIVPIPNAHVVILQSKWYDEYTKNMVQECCRILEQAEATVEHHVLPGALEMPLAAQALLRSGKGVKAIDVIVCFGILLKGETFHFEMIMDECIRGLGKVMLEEGTPIIVEILPVTSLAQAEERSGEDGFNKGIEAALATIEIITWRRENLRS